jgi:3D (Asp-Asp-Asp) domain-containing protein
MVGPRGALRRGAAAVTATLAGWLLHAPSPAEEALAERLRIPRKTGYARKARQPRRQVILEVDGQRRPLKTRRQTIARVLTEAEVELGARDEVWPPLCSPVYEGMTITVARITVCEAVVIEKIPYRIKAERVQSRWHRYPTIKRHGKAGRVSVRYEVTCRDGVPIRRRVLARLVLEPSVTQLVELPPNRILSSRGMLGGARVLSMIATAYDPGPQSCGPGATGRTCLGLRAGHGVVAVDPRHIPLRTRLFIEGYGYAVAGDVGSAIKGNRIDLGYHSRSAALRFGRRRVKVYVLD